MNHADYEIVRVEEDRVFIVDLDLGKKSVTNDSDFVYDEVRKVFPGKRIIYRDTMGNWDEIVKLSKEDLKDEIKKYMIIPETQIIPYEDHVPSSDEITGFPSSEFIRKDSKDVLNNFPFDIKLWNCLNERKKYYK